MKKKTNKITVKTSKKNTKKKVAKKKTTKKKVVKPRRNPLIALPPLYNLHKKKLEIMAAVPIMPCSAISHDRQGNIYHHTQATKVFYTYNQLLIEKQLVINMIECTSRPATYVIDVKVGEKWEVIEVPCTEVCAKFRITDAETGQYEDFKSVGLGDNEVWSATSAVTVCMKEAYLVYFHTCWPEEDTTIKTMQQAIKKLPRDQVVKAIEAVVGKEAWKIMTDTKAVEELKKHFGG